MTADAIDRPAPRTDDDINTTTDATTAALELPEPAPTPTVRRRVSFSRPHRWWLAAILFVNGLMGLWDLQRVGLQNTFYAAAAWSAGRSWHAFFFAGLDPAGGASIDKPPLAVWVQGLSVRVFGFNSSALLVPQVLMGVGCSALLYVTVRRLAGSTAGLLAAAAMTFTPVAVWMFKSDNPDPLMVLLLVASAYFLLRALDSGGIGWMVACGAAVGFAFEAKMLEAVVVVPGLVLAYLICGGNTLIRRLIGLVVAAATMMVTGLWWMVVVQATPAADRPYISSTDSNSVFDLAFGYNGAARLAASASSLRTTDRLFLGTMGLLISFLLPAALLAIAVLLIGPRGGRRSPYRAAGLLFGGWLLSGAVTLTYSTGLINVYYVLVIAPPIAALVAIGGVGLWRHRDRPAAVMPLTLSVVLTAIWGAVKLHPTHPAWAALSVLAAVLAIALTATALWPSTGDRVSGRPRVTALAAAFVVVGLLLPASATAVGQVGAVHEPPMYFAKEPALLALIAADRSDARFAAAVIGGRQAAELELQTGRAVLDIGGYHGTNSLPTLPTLEHLVLAGQIHYYELAVRPVRPPAPPRVPRRPSGAVVTVPAGVDHRVPARTTRPAARSNAHPPTHGPLHPSRAQGLTAQFLEWVVARYPVTYSSPTDKLYDLLTPLRPHPARQLSRRRPPATARPRPATLVVSDCTSPRTHHTGTCSPPT